jgi:hypothetical protein
VLGGAPGAVLQADTVRETIAVTAIREGRCREFMGNLTV